MILEPAHSEETQDKQWESHRKHLQSHQSKLKRGYCYHVFPYIFTSAWCFAVPSEVWWGMTYPHQARQHPPGQLHSHAISVNPSVLLT